MISRRAMPGSEGIMNSYSRIMNERGFNPAQEQDEVQRKIFDNFMTNARQGRSQGSGKFSGKYPATAIGFQKYLADQTAYNLHQGEGGKAYYDKISKAQW